MNAVHARILCPKLGIRKPPMGVDLDYDDQMQKKKKPRRPKYVALRQRRILGDNVRRLMEQKYEHEPDKVTALAQDSGVGRGTIQRIIAGDQVGATIDIITQIANGLHVDVHELLTPQATR